MANVTLENKLFSYNIEHKPIRSIRLRLQTKSSFTISCHQLTPSFIINRFIHEHSSWIIKNSLKLKSSTPLSQIDSLNILGDTYHLNYRQGTTDSVVIFDTTHQIYINTTSFSSYHLRHLLNQKFRPLALKLIKKELNNLSIIHGFKYGWVSVRNQSSRYGSCSFRGNLNFNWQIIFFPLLIFRHLLLHELTHLKIKNHSSNFWNQLKLYDSNCRVHNLWLKKEGSKHFIV